MTERYFEDFSLNRPVFIPNWMFQLNTASYTYKSWEEKCAIFPSIVGVKMQQRKFINNLIIEGHKCDCDVCIQHEQGICIKLSVHHIIDIPNDREVFLNISCETSQYSSLTGCLNSILHLIPTRVGKKNVQSSHQLWVLKCSRGKL